MDRIGRKWIVYRGQRRAADQFCLKLKLVAEAVSHSLQDQNRLFDDFRADAIARENGEIQEH